MGIAGKLRATITVETGKAGFERFLNICRANKIAIFNIETIENKNLFRMNAKDFKLLKPIAKKTGCRFKIIKKSGIPFLLFRYRKHYCFLIGIAIAFVILYTSTLFIWEIKFDGNTELTDNVLLKYLATIDVSVGMKQSSVNCSGIEEALRKKYDNVTWASVELAGTKIIVHIKENDGFNKESATGHSGDLIAAYNGEIVSIITRKGTAKVKAGDTVSSTDVLVSSEVIVYNDSKEPIGSFTVDADADILIKTQLTYQDSLPACYEYKLYTGNTKDYFRLTVFDKTFEIGGFFGNFESCDESVVEEQLKLNNSFYLPVKLGRKQSIEYISEFGTYTEEEAKEHLLENLAVYLQKLEKKGVQIIDTSVTMESSSSMYTMAGMITVICSAYD